MTIPVFVLDGCAKRACSVLAPVSIVLLFAANAEAAPISIDLFAKPDPATAYVIALIDVNPLLIETADAGILGGERDLLVSVDGVANLVAATGVIGDGTYLFGTSGAGASATLQYDGLDADIVGPLAELINSEA